MLRKSCASHFFNGKMNGYSPEQVTFRPLPVGAFFDYGLSA